MPAEVMAPMPGKVVEVKVKVGDTVEENDPVVILEAMKIEMPVVAVASGKVTEVNCEAGQSVEGDAVLVKIE